MTINRYDAKLSRDFQKSDYKPDKKYSFLPTILGIIGDLENKTALDLGCGDGFFTKALFFAGAKEVIGVDNSKEQLELAEGKKGEENITYSYCDIFQDPLPTSNITLSPFVANYAEDRHKLEFLFRNIYENLSENGRVIFVVDMPKNKNLKRFGSIKTILGKLVDGVKIKIDLYNEEEFICTLYSYYYTPETIEELLKKVGFKEMRWHKPKISQEGIDKYGEKFWEGFTEDSELGYLEAIK